MSSNARNLSKLLGTSTQVPTTALPPAIADLETVGQTLSGGEIAPSSIKSNTLTQSFDSNQAVTFNMADSIDAVSPIVSVFKEVPQQGFSSKGQWDVNANATNYDFYDEKPYSTYASSTLTPSATGDGTFTSSSMIIGPTDIDNLTYDNKSINITSLNHTGTGTWGDLKGFYIKPDGTKLFSLSDAGIVSEHVLSTAYDISTTTYNNVDTSALTTETSAAFDTNLALSPDGTKLFVLQSATKEIARYDLSTAWDLSTLSATKHSYYIEAAGGLNFPISFTFNADGTVLIIFYNSADDIVKYDLSTAWDLSTASRDSSFTIVANSASSTAYVGSTLGIALHSLEFTNNGNVLLGSDYAQQKIYQWNLTSPYSITSTSLVYDTQFSITLLAGNNVSYGPGPLRVLNGKAYIVDGGSKSIIYQYTSSASNVFNASDVGKKVVGNSGSAIITSAAGAYTSVTAFADTSAISSWQLFGAQGKSDGSGITLAGFSSDFDISSAGSELYNSVDTYLTGFNIKFSNDGTRLFLVGNNGSWLGQVYRWDLNTAYDLNSIVTNGGANTTGSLAAAVVDLTFNSDGSLMYVLSGGNVYKYTATNNAFTGSGLSVTLSNTADISSIGVDNWSFEFSSDGTKLYIGQFLSNFGGVRQLNLTTAWDPAAGFTDAYAYTITEDTIALNKALPYAIRFIDNGSKMLVLGGRNDEIYQYTLSTAWDLSTASYSNKKYSNSSIADFQGFDLSADTSMMFTFERNNNQNYYRSFNISSVTNIVLPYSQYSPALTNSSTGQINSSAWQDINSMTADETKNDGDIFYAVSTDNRTSWGVAKASDGVRKIARNNSGTWQYNNHAGTNNPWQYNSAAASGNTLTISSAFNYGTWLTDGGTHSDANVKFSPDGTKIFWAPAGGNSDGDDIYTANLSTAWDLSTATQGPVYTEYSSSGYGQASFAFNSDGTKLYTVVRASTGSTNRTVRQWSLSTAYDVSTSSYVGASSSIGPYSIKGIYIAPDESYFITTDLVSGANYIKKWNLATAGDITSTLTGETAVDVTSYTNWSAPAVGSFYATTPDFFDSGNKIVIVNHGNGGSNTNDAYLIELSTAYNITSGTVIGKFTTATGANSYGVGVKPDGSKLYALNGTGGIVEFNTGAVNYETSETWVNGTNNNEHATLQEALGAQAFNRMNKAQLDAIADGYHFSQDSADTLDLMIAPYAASGTSPISDGVTINYDAEALIREAIPGTDYIAEFPNPTTLNITAVGAANLKIRAQ